MVVLAFVVVGCSPPRVNNTRLTGTDLVAMTDQMAASLTNAPGVTQRRVTPWIIATDLVVNHTNDIIPAGEKEAYLARLRALLNQANVPGMQFVHEVQLSGPNRTTPTHALTAHFYALTNDSRTARSDAYLCAFSLQDLQTDAVVWEGRYEVKYQIIRNKFD
jgi:PBP1b-binding outer membrane lipoprotein LpoB